MVKTTIQVEGMACGMCETHINEAIRRNFKVKKVKSSRRRKETVIVSETPIDGEQLAKVIAETGYTPGAVHTEP